jgi:hypothetical protein
MIPFPFTYSFNHSLHRYFSSDGFHFIYFCKIYDPAAPSNNRYGLAAGTLKVAEFSTTKLAPNSTSAVAKSMKELFRRAFRTIEEISLEELARAKYCPDECTVGLNVSASSSAHGDNEKLCNNPRARVPATLQPSLQASYWRFVPGHETIMATFAALVALAVFGALVVLVVWALKLLCCVALPNLVLGKNGDSADLGPSDALQSRGGARHRDPMQTHNGNEIELRQMTGRAILSRPAGEVRVESETDL